MERRADAEERQMDRWRKKQPPQEKDRWTKRASVFTSVMGELLRIQMCVDRREKNI
jgi:hypothetical protein